MKEPEKGGLSEEDMNDMKLSNEWIDNFFTSRVTSKKNEFLMIIRGLARAMKASEPEENVKYDKLKKRSSICSSSYSSIIILISAPKI